MDLCCARTDVVIAKCGDRRREVAGRPRQVGEHHGPDPDRVGRQARAGAAVPRPRRRERRRQQRPRSATRATPPLRRRRRRDTPPRRARPAASSRRGRRPLRGSWSGWRSRLSAPGDRVAHRDIFPSSAARSRRGRSNRCLANVMARSPHQHRPGIDESAGDQLRAVCVIADRRHHAVVLVAKVRVRAGTGRRASRRRRSDIGNIGDAAPVGDDPLTTRRRATPIGDAELEQHGTRQHLGIEDTFTRPPRPAQRGSIVVSSSNGRGVASRQQRLRQHERDTAPSVGSTTLGSQRQELHRCVGVRATAAFARPAAWSSPQPSATGTADCRRRRRIDRALPSRPPTSSAHTTWWSTPAAASAALVAAAAAGSMSTPTTSSATSPSGAVRPSATRKRPSPQAGSTIRRRRCGADVVIDSATASTTSVTRWSGVYHAPCCLRSGRNRSESGAATTRSCRCSRSSPPDTSADYGRG